MVDELNPSSGMMCGGGQSGTDHHINSAHSLKTKCPAWQSLHSTIALRASMKLSVQGKLIPLGILTKAIKNFRRTGTTRWEIHK